MSEALSFTFRIAGTLVLLTFGAAIWNVYASYSRGRRLTRLKQARQNRNGLD